MITCNKCRKDNKDTAKFCAGCGAKLLPIPAVQPVERIIPEQIKPKGNICPQCGEQNKETAKFCSGCGYKLTIPAPPVQQPENIVIATSTNDQVLCSQCGRPNKPHAKFCVGCGTVLQQPTLSSQSIQADIDLKKPTAGTEIAAKPTPIVEEIAPPAVIVEKEILQANAQETITGNELEPNVDVVKQEDLIVETPPIIEEENKESGGLPVTESVEDWQAIVQNEEIELGVEEDAQNLTTDEEYNALFPERKRVKPVFWIMGILIIALVGIGAYYYFSKSAGKAGDSTSVGEKDSVKQMPITSGKPTIVKKGVDKKNTGKKDDPVKVTTPNASVVPVVIPTQDNFKFLGMGQFKADLLNKQLCEGLVFTGRNQRLAVIGPFPNESSQKKLEDVIVKVRITDITENRGCTLALYYKKQGNRFSLENYDEQ